MAWDEIREWADRPVLLPFSATIRVDVADGILAEPVGRRIAVDIIEAQIGAFAEHLGLAFLHPVGCFSRRVLEYSNGERASGFMGAAG